MVWQARLDIDYRLEALDAESPGGPAAAAGRTVGHSQHHGPLRILRSLYPEGPGVCHHVIVHPPGGVAGGDGLSVHARLADRSHALLTTPGATRFYRSSGETAVQTVDAHVAPGARLEWLPLETLVHDGARARNRLAFHLEAGAEMMGWDFMALGLPASGQAFERGRFEQAIEVSVGSAHSAGGEATAPPSRPAAGPVWLERSVLDFDAPQAATTRRLLRSPLGWGGHTVLATLWLASGRPIDEARRDRLLESARACTPAEAMPWGVTAPGAHLVVLRALGPRVEPLMLQAIAVWSAWRREAWQLDASAPRVWRT